MLPPATAERISREGPARKPAATHSHDRKKMFGRLVWGVVSELLCLVDERAAGVYLLNLIRVGGPGVLWRVCVTTL
jgi:hypothetical protein